MVDVRVDFDHVDYGVVRRVVCGDMREVVSDQLVVVAPVNHLIHDDRALSRLFQVLVLVAACGWGIDYMQHPPHGDLYVFERMMDNGPVPLPLIGGLLLALGLVGLVGEWWFEVGDRQKRGSVPPICTARNRWLPSFIAHSGLCAAYLAIGGGAWIQMCYSGHWYGWRMTGGALLISFVNYIYAQRRRNAT